MHISQATSATANTRVRTGEDGAGDGYDSSSSSSTDGSEWGPGTDDESDDDDDVGKGNQRKGSKPKKHTGIAKATMEVQAVGAADDEDDQE